MTVPERQLDAKKLGIARAFGNSHTIKTRTMAKGLTKSQFMTALSETWGLKKAEAQERYEAFVNLVYGEVKSKGEITLPGLGKVVKKDRAARMGRNPATGESIHIPAKTVLKFRVNKAAKDAIL